jgi:thiamine kinase-like enzyme
MDKFPSLEEIRSIYETNTNNKRHVTKVELISILPRLQDTILEYLVTYVQEGSIKKEAVIGKAYSQYEKGISSYHFLKFIWTNSFYDLKQFKVVRPIAFIPKQNFFLMSKAPGRKLEECLYDRTLDHIHIANQIAKWLTHMHNIPHTSFQVSTPKRTNPEINRYSHELIVLLPHEQSRVTSICQQLSKKLNSLLIDRAVLLHGDFHTRNIFFTPSQVVAIDFDHHFIGDPAWEIAYLICQIEISSYFKLGVFDAFSVMIQKIVATYLQANPFYDCDQFYDRLSFYRVCCYLESLHYELCVLKTGNQVIPEPFLHHCQTCLQGKNIL